MYSQCFTQVECDSRFMSWVIPLSCFIWASGMQNHLLFQDPVVVSCHWFTCLMSVFECAVPDSKGLSPFRGGKEVERCFTAWFRPLHTREPLAPAAYWTWSFHRASVDIQGDRSKRDRPTCFTTTPVWSFLTLWSSHTLWELLALVTCVFNANTALAL